MKFKGKSFIAIVLAPEEPIKDWFAELDRISERSPGFFIDRPIVLDLRGSKMPVDDIEVLLGKLAERAIRVMGIDGVSGSRLKPGMPPSFSGGRLTKKIDLPAPDGSGTATKAGDQKVAGPASKSAEKEPSRAVANAGQTAVADKPANPEDDLDGKSASIVVTEHVRSGQCILNPEGDVTIVGSVSSGAEVIAGGSIHIYGALRGRALAGVAGDDAARIFCSHMDAELVSINGLYKIADDFDRQVLKGPAQIRFEDETLVFERLG